jgi:hypothetical protein
MTYDEIVSALIEQTWPTSAWRVVESDDDHVVVSNKFDLVRIERGTGLMTKTCRSTNYTGATEELTGIVRLDTIENPARLRELMCVRFIPTNLKARGS